jgi:uncharacterized membrane protein SirB2
MLEFYSEIRFVHIAAVTASGLLFFARGLGMVHKASWFMAAPVRYLSYTIDTILLTAALMLTTIVGQYPFADGWLTMKVVLLAVYIALGTFALKRGKTFETRIKCWAAALLVFLFIVSIALTKHPLGFLAVL